MDLQEFWFVLIGVLIAGYAILDGFDLGVGIIHPLVEGDENRRIVLNSIGPLWDGNEVWLVTFGGALFAAFPEAYATLFSAFYLPFMLLMAASIGRAVAIEFRSKAQSKLWRTWWDHSFALSSFTAVFLFGVTAGNIIQGIPLDASFHFTGNVLDLLRPYPILVGAFAVVTAVLHGACYLTLKTEGELRAQLARLRWPAFGVFVGTFFVLTTITLVNVPHARENFAEWPIAWAAVGVLGLAAGAIPRALVKEQPLAAFAASSATIAALVALLGVTLFPYLIISSEPANSLDIYDAASSETTLSLMRIIAFIGLPFVLAYTGTVYWVFRGKTKLDEFSY